jgi:hypothetical protein
MIFSYCYALNNVWKTSSGERFNIRTPYGYRDELAGLAYLPYWWCVVDEEEEV